MHMCLGASAGTIWALAGGSSFLPYAEAEVCVLHMHLRVFSTCTCVCAFLCLHAGSAGHVAVSHAGGCCHGAAQRAGATGGASNGRYAGGPAPAQDWCAAARMHHCLGWPVHSWWRAVHVHADACRRWAQQVHMQRSGPWLGAHVLALASFCALEAGPHTEMLTNVWLDNTWLDSPPSAPCRPCTLPLPHALPHTSPLTRLQQVWVCAWAWLLCVQA